MFSCLNIENIENQSLKRLLDIRCNRLEGPRYIKDNSNNILLKIIFIILICYLIYKIFKKAVLLTL